MEQLIAGRCIETNEWARVWQEHENQGNLEMARETLLIYHYLSKNIENWGQFNNVQPIDETLEKIELKMLVKLAEEIPYHHLQLFFPSLLSVNLSLPGRVLPGHVLGAIKPLATTTILEADILSETDIDNSHLSALCCMCGKFCVTKSPTIRIPGVSILLGRRITCQYNCGVSFCSDLCHIQHSGLHGDLCRILPDFFKQTEILKLCKYKSFLALKTLAGSADKLKQILSQQDVKSKGNALGMSLLSEFLEILFNVANRNSNIVYTRQEVLQLFNIIYFKSVCCFITNVPIDLPFSALRRCKIWVFSPELIQYFQADSVQVNADQPDLLLTGNEDAVVNGPLACSWQNGKVFVRVTGEFQQPYGNLYIKYDTELFNSDVTNAVYRCRFCIVGFCKAGSCEVCKNPSREDFVAEADDENFIMIMAKYGYDSPFLLRALIKYIDSRQLGPFSYSKNITKFLVRSALCLVHLASTHYIQLIPHILGKLCKLISLTCGYKEETLQIAKLSAYNYYKLFGRNCLGVAEMAEMASQCGTNWIAYPFTFNVSEAALLDDISKKVYGPSTFISFPLSSQESTVALAFAASRTVIPVSDEIFDVVRKFVLEFEKMGVVHLPTGLTPLGLTLYARNGSLLSNLGLEPRSDIQLSDSTDRGEHFYFYQTPSPLIVTLLKLEMRSLASKSLTSLPITSYLHNLIKLVPNKQEFVDARTSEIEGLETAMHYAAWANNLSLVKFLVNHGALINPLSGLGLTPLDLAASAGHLNIIKCLMENGNGVISATSLFLACCGLKVDAVEYLLKFCASSNNGEANAVNDNDKALKVDDLPMYFGLVWHGIAFAVCNPNNRYFDDNNNAFIAYTNDTISRLNCAVGVTKLLINWGFKQVSVLDGKLPSDTIKSLSVKFLEKVHVSSDQLHYASIAQSLIYLGHLFEGVQSETLF